ncbi:hypothetical protein AVEN_47511-1 [Araneus ventricosus]|uniref:Uncharacterized protein n=1 Tax=Araneus ventricosus TaxID=182803 RepID=A0A4Y2FJE2_ARAVE|nr:hypothetical protein AVEN_47511-1 [Araneus ventricosus]
MKKFFHVLWSPGIYRYTKDKVFIGINWGLIHFGLHGTRNRSLIGTPIEEAIETNHYDYKMPCVGKFHVCVFGHPTTSAIEPQISISCVKNVLYDCYTTPSTARRNFQRCSATPF